METLQGDSVVTCEFQRHTSVKGAFASGNIGPKSIQILSTSNSELKDLLSHIKRPLEQEP